MHNSNNIIKDIKKESIGKEIFDKPKYQYKDNPHLQNTFSMFSGHKQLTFDDSAIVERKAKEGKYTLEIKSISTLSEFLSENNQVKTSVNKLLTCLIIKSGSTGYCSKEITISLKEYLEMLGRKVSSSNVKEVRKEVNNDLKTLMSSHLSFITKGRNKQQNFYNISIIQASAVVDGSIKVILSDFMYDYLYNQKWYLNLPPCILQCNSKLEPHGFLLGVYLTSMLRQSNTYPVRTISVKSIYNQVTTLPRYEDIKANGRRVEQQIKIPLEKQLDKFQDEYKILKWQYSENYTGKETFEEWLNLNIIVTALYDIDNVSKIQKNKKTLANKFKKAELKGIEKAVTEKAKRKELKEAEKKSTLPKG